MNIKRITIDALLTAIALTIFVIELQIPNFIPIPGIKLGLANIITVITIFIFGPVDAAFVLISRILLGGIFSGKIVSLMYSIAGGFLCYISMAILKKFVSEQQIWVCSIIGAVAHNIGQISIAIFLTSTKELIVYLPVLMISGIAAGTFTGLCAQFTIRHLRRVSPSITDIIEKVKKNK